LIDIYDLILIFLVQGMLSVSRAFGDLDFKTKNLITCYPEVKYWPMTEETEFIVAACDGVWFDLFFF
jgi:serine/threonine protein phosphatase PrpC